MNTIDRENLLNIFNQVKGQELDDIGYDNQVNPLVLSPEKKIFEGEVNYAKFPGTDGEFGVLNNHAPIISNLKKGTIEVTDTNNVRNSFEINGGVIELKNNKIIVLSD